jgi:hypothetical protein
LDIPIAVAIAIAIDYPPNLGELHIMSRTSFVAALLTVITAIACTHAQAVQRTHVSAATGSDSNTATNCTAAAPCRFFQAALSVTDPNGEVIVLDSGGYGAVTITQSVALIAPPGVYGGITVFPSATGVTIAAPGVNVVLRGLTINGQGGTYGIFMSAGAGSKLSVENCVISNMVDSGIYAFGGSDIRIVDSTFRVNGQYGIFLFNGARGTIARSIVSASGSNGILVSGLAASTTTFVDIADTTVDATIGNGNGISASSSNATATVRVSVRDSRVVRNSRYGMAAESTAGAAAIINASNNIVSNNGVGLGAFGSGGKVIASGNTVAGNLSAGFFNFGSVFESAGNNTVRDNGANSGTITVFAPQ